MRYGYSLGYSRGVSSSDYGFGFTARLPGETGRDRTFERLGEGTWAEVTGGDLPQPILVRFGRSERGTLVVTGLIIGAAEAVEITSRDVRTIKLAEILAALSDPKVPGVQKLGLRLSPDTSLTFFTAPRGYLTDALMELAGGASKGIAPRPRPGRKGYPPEHFQEVADAYREACMTHPRSPFLALTRHLHVSEATARRWVGVARSRGFLGPAIPGKAGEGKTPASEKKRHQRRRSE